jgi:hypothetical protein
LLATALAALGPCSAHGGHVMRFSWPARQILPA